MNRTAIRRNTELASTIYSTEHIRATLERASLAEQREGTLWYLSAHAEALKLTQRYDVSIPQAAGIIAALSPQNGWDNNLVAADAFLASDGTAYVHFANAVHKAQAILGGDHPLDALRGPKVRSFYHNILYPDLAGYVTVDRHACAVAANLPTPQYLREYPKTLERSTVYGYVAALYRTVARDYGILPHEVQAIVWVTHRNTDPAYEPF